MTEQQRAAALYWLLQHAELGEMREGMSEEQRQFAVTFIQSAIDLSPETKTAEALATITHGKVEGIYHGKD